MVLGDGMTIEQIDKGKVLILLCNSDMKDFSLDYNKMGFCDPHSKKILVRLLTLACLKTGISAKGKKMLVEALPQENGCIILLTLVSENKRRVYRIKRNNYGLCFVFGDLENLIKLCIALKDRCITENRIYYCNSKYYLIFESILPPKYKRLVCEYADKGETESVHWARVKENGKLIAENNAIATLGKYFGK
ncbi:MAG: adaptor protein MecA [Ruminococcus sp.]